MRTVYWLLTKVRVQKPKMLRERERERSDQRKIYYQNQDGELTSMLFFIFIFIWKVKSINSTFSTYLIHFDTFLILLKVWISFVLTFKKSNHLSWWNWYWNIFNKYLGSISGNISLSNLSKNYIQYFSLKVYLYIFRFYNFSKRK